MDYPTLLDMEFPKINSYSVETVIAEKFETIVKLNYQTSRMKDFYDIIFIAENYNLQRMDLLNSIEKTFKKRNTSIDNRKIIYEDEYKNDVDKQRQWKGFLNRIKTEKSDISDNFKTTVNKLESFIEPIFDNSKSDLSWNKEIWGWK